MVLNCFDAIGEKIVNRKNALTGLWHNKIYASRKIMRHGVRHGVRSSRTEEFRPIIGKLRSINGARRSLLDCKSTAYANKYGYRKGSGTIFRVPRYFETDEMRYRTVKFCLKRGKWGLCYDGDTKRMTGPFDTKEKARRWFLNQGR